MIYVCIDILIFVQPDISTYKRGCRPCAADPWDQLAQLVSRRRCETEARVWQRDWKLALGIGSNSQAAGFGSHQHFFVFCFCMMSHFACQVLSSGAWSHHVASIFAPFIYSPCCVYAVCVPTVYI